MLIKKVVLIIRKEHEQIFEDTLVKKIRPFIEVEYAYQDLNNIPKGSSIPDGRVKPWGTTHALLSCKGIVKDDLFVVCNADDYYGKDAFNKIIKFFHEGITDTNYCMVGYKVENTLSDNGTVTSGICQKDENDYLTHIEETMNIQRNGLNIEYTKDNQILNLDSGSPVSMNFWGFKPSIFEKLEIIFNDEFEDGVKNNPLKYEALLPNDVGKLIKANKCKVTVLTSNDSWFGVTYKEDKPNVVAKF